MILKDIKFANLRDHLIIKNNVINVFRKHKQKQGANEVGGILLGYVYRNHSKIVKFTIPTKLDTFGPHFFIRSKISAQAQINKAWVKSRGTLIYLGEWHTHSETNPIPSYVDRRMIMKSLKETRMEIDFLYLIIVGNNYNYWVGKRTRRKLAELKRIM